MKCWQLFNSAPSFWFFSPFPLFCLLFGKSKCCNNNLSSFCSKNRKACQRRRSLEQIDGWMTAPKDIRPWIHHQRAQIRNVNGFCFWVILFIEDTGNFINYSEIVYIKLQLIRCTRERRKSIKRPFMMKSDNFIFWLKRQRFYGTAF